MKQKTSFPNIPFIASVKSDVAPDIVDIVAASEARGIIESNERDLEQHHRYERDAFAIEQAAHDKELGTAMDYYDGHAKRERGQGNREFLLAFAKGTCAAVAALLVIDVIVKVAGGRS